jgi:hypothetical protein
MFMNVSFFLSYFLLHGVVKFFICFILQLKLEFLKKRPIPPPHQNRKKFECVATSCLLLPLLGQWTMHTVFFKEIWQPAFFLRTPGDCDCHPECPLASTLSFQNLLPCIETCHVLPQNAQKN